MGRITSAGIVLLIFLMSQAHADPPGLFTGLGPHRHDIGTRNPAAQRFFDQGLMLSFAFNHSEAAESFRQVQRLDPDSPMGYWGEALVLGPSINCCMAGEDAQAAARALQEAQKRLDRASPRHRDYIAALAERYAPGGHRQVLNLAYARAMAAVAERHPEDDDAQVLAAEAWMDTSPWDYWTPEAAPKPVAEKVLPLLKRVLARNPQHPMANHLFVHAVESAHPEWALESAKRLETLVPGAGHLVHMPSHIYLRLGRYGDANRINRQAIAADVEYLRQREAWDFPPRGQDPHNHRFLWFGETMAGEREASFATARQLRRMPGPGGGVLQQDYVVPLWTMVRFGAWDDVLAEAEPRGGLPYAVGVWRFARGMAFARRGAPAEAQRELQALQRAAAEAGTTRPAHGGNSDSALLAVAERLLAGAVAESGGDLAGGLASLREAARLEDGLAYAEPAAWPLPARQYLGAVLLRAGRPDEAEAVYREDLARYPANGWSLSGLARALEARGQSAQAERLRAAAKWDVSEGSVY